VTTPASASALIGAVLDGKYRLDSMIGRGGMGAVFRGTVLSVERRVAIKIIHPELASDPAVARRFVREARGTFRVDSDHAIKVIDFAVCASAGRAGLLYMVMEFLDGRTVARELDVDGQLSPRRALHVARQVALALAAAHKVGIVHRDIKPDNIMLVRQGDDPDFAKVLDFGLAKLVEDAPPDAALSAVALTKHGMVFGTPDYMSPEQATGKPLDARSDVYALGAALFEMLTARPPFVGANAMAVLVQHVKTPPPHLGELAPALASHTDLDALVQRCLAKPAAMRPPTALDLVALIDRVAATLPHSAETRRAGAAETMQLPSLAPDQARPEGGHSVWLARLSDEGDAPPQAEPLYTPRGGWGLPAAEPSAQGASAQVPSAGASSTSMLADRLEPTTGLSRPVHVRRWPLVGAGLAVVGVAAVIIALQTRGSDAKRAGGGDPPRVANGVEPRDAAIAPPPPPATPDAAPTVVPVALPDAAPRSPDSTTAAAAERERKRREQIAAHLAAAEAGYAAHNRLKQMTEADEVLHLDRSHPRANFLFGDALVQARDLTNGCAYLKKSRSRAAKERMAEVGCK
jgi:serine/threonine protein kinase